jgi:hypothetical protein
MVGSRAPWSHRACGPSPAEAEPEAAGGCAAGRDGGGRWPGLEEEPADGAGDRGWAQWSTASRIRKGEGGADRSRPAREKEEDAKGGGSGLEARRSLISTEEERRRPHPRPRRPPGRPLHLGLRRFVCPFFDSSAPALPRARSASVRPPPTRFCSGGVDGRGRVVEMASGGATREGRGWWGPQTVELGKASGTPKNARARRVAAFCSARCGDGWSRYSAHRCCKMQMQRRLREQLETV